jgi:uncharacterized membrane protein
LFKKLGFLLKIKFFSTFSKFIKTKWRMASKNRESKNGTQEQALVFHIKSFWYAFWWENLNEFFMVGVLYTQA